MAQQILVYAFISENTIFQSIIPNSPCTGQSIIDCKVWSKQNANITQENQGGCSFSILLFNYFHWNVVCPMPQVRATNLQREFGIPTSVDRTEEGRRSKDKQEEEISMEEGNRELEMPPTDNGHIQMDLDERIKVFKGLEKQDCKGRHSGFRVNSYRVMKLEMDVIQWLREIHTSASSDDAGFFLWLNNADSLNDLTKAERKICLPKVGHQHEGWEDVHLHSRGKHKFLWKMKPNRVKSILPEAVQSHSGGKCQGASGKFSIFPVDSMVIIEEFQKCHLDHPIAKFWGECTELKIKLDRCFRQEKAINRKANFEASKRSQERLRATRAAMKSANLESPSPSDAAD
eukprot:Gb_13317 [translate_table: standard]